MENKKTYISQIPELISEWDWEKNSQIGIFPDKISHGSTKYAYWICKEKHSYKARVDHRTISKSGCPYCQGALPIRGVNDLETLYPELVKEWDFDKNASLEPREFKPMSNKKVWWKCQKCGYSWKTAVEHRTMGKSNCPKCALKQRPQTKIQKLVRENGSLLDFYPELCKEWDYERNVFVKPNELTKGSNKKVWWLCSECGYSFKKTINARTSGQGCPVCAGKKALVGYNDLFTVAPLLKKEWHYERNQKTDPQKMTKGSDEKVWWKCEKGHEWEATISSRVAGCGCPVCSNRVIISGENDLLTLRPDIAKHWHPTKNKISANEVGVNSNKKAWWQCEKGHEWYAVINSRTSGRGCPVCVSERFTSFPEQAILYYISKVTDAKSRCRVLEKEIDVFLPELNVGIEYNGFYYHRNRKKYDDEKEAFFKANGIRMIRVEEGDESYYEGDVIYYKYKNNYCDFETVIDRIAEIFVLPQIDANIERDRAEIYEQYLQNEKENSLAVKFPNVAEEWNYERNGKLTPDLISYGSDKKVWWKCSKCNNEWQAIVSSRSAGRGCPECGKEKNKEARAKTFLNQRGSLAENRPDIAQQWHPTLNLPLTAEMVTGGSDKKAWWICEMGHEWEAVISSRVAGRGCPYCAGKKVVEGYNDLATKAKHLLSEWDYTKNNIQPTEITAGSHRKVRWKCSECGYEWLAVVKSRVAGCGCPGCGKKKQKNSHT